MSSAINPVSEINPGITTAGLLDYARLKADVRRLVEQCDRDHLRFILHRHMLGVRLHEERALDDRYIVTLSKDLKIDRSVLDGSMKLAKAWPKPSDLKKLVIEHCRKNGNPLTFSHLVQLADLNPGSPQFTEALEITCNENLQAKEVKQLKSQTKASLKRAAKEGQPPAPRAAIRAIHRLSGEIEAFVDKAEAEMAEAASVTVTNEVSEALTSLMEQYQRLSKHAQSKVQFLHQQLQAAKAQIANNASAPLGVVENDSESTSDTDWDDPIEANLASPDEGDLQPDEDNDG